MATNDVPLPNGSLFMTMTPERREKVEFLLGMLQGGLIWASLEHNIHRVVVADAMTQALVWAVGKWGHKDIANAIRTMFGTVFVWPEDKRSNELAEVQATALTHAVSEVISRAGAVDENKDEAQLVLLKVFANATIHWIANAWGEEAGKYVKEKLQTAGDWSIAKGMGPTNGKVN
jgi:hypothetical protein